MTTISDHVGNDAEAIPDAMSGEPDDRKVITLVSLRGCELTGLSACIAMSLPAVIFHETSKANQITLYERTTARILLVSLHHRVSPSYFKLSGLENEVFYLRRQQQFCNKI